METKLRFFRMVFKFETELYFYSKVFKPTGIALADDIEPVDILNLKSVCSSSFTNSCRPTTYPGKNVPIFFKIHSWTNVPIFFWQSTRCLADSILFVRQHTLRHTVQHTHCDTKCTAHYNTQYYTVCSTRSVMLRDIHVTIHMHTLHGLQRNISKERELEKEKVHIHTMRKRTHA